MQTVDTHRAELRELNELNYARLDSRVTELRQVTDARLDVFGHELRADITTLRMENAGRPCRSAGRDAQLGFAEAKVTSAEPRGEDRPPSSPSS